MKKNIKKITWISFIAIGALLIFFPNKARVQNEDFPFDPSFAQLKNLDERHPKIDHMLYMILQVYENSSLEHAKKIAKGMDVDFVGDDIRVVAVENRMPLPNGAKGSIPLTPQIQALGGAVETSYKDLYQSTIGLYALRSLSDLPSVGHVRLPYKPRELVVSEGVQNTGAGDWHSLTSYHSQGAKVCILDGGFTGYGALLGTELPSTVETRSFRADNNLETSVHGTACAEIVHDMAPDAQLGLVNFGTDVEHHNAVAWIISEGYQVVSYSMGWGYSLGPGTGSGPIHDDVEDFVDSGGVWVGAAGNSAEDHWQGNFSDPDSDGRLNFAVGSEWFGFRVYPFVPFIIWLRWNDWGDWNGTNFNTSRDYSDWDMRLYSAYGGGAYLWGAFGVQGQNRWAYEIISGWANFYASLSVTVNRWWDPNVGTREFDLEFWNCYGIEHPVAAGSVTLPGDSPDSLTVGAIDHATNAYHTYSSQGPTDDGRIKPDICAPAGVSTNTYGPALAAPPGLLSLFQLRPYGFYGTSAATPHVAGALGLILDKTGFSPIQAKDVVLNRLIEMGAAGKDNMFGAGRLNLRNN